MAVTNQEIAEYLVANPQLTDADILAAMQKYNISPAQISEASRVPEGEVIARIAETLPPGSNANVGGVWVQPVYEETGQGETFQQGPLKEVLVYNQNQQTGDPYKQYSPTGDYIKSGQFKNTGNFGDLAKDLGKAVGPIALMAATAGGAGGLLGGALGLTGTAASAAGGALLGGGGAALTGGNVLQGALLGGAGGYLQGAGGLGAQTDASFLAADAAQLAKAGLSEAQIAQTLGAAGYASGPAANLAASMAINGLDVGTMTNQLNNLSTNTGLMSQTGSSADFLAADALQLQKQVGNNFAAIEQNLIASGVDPLIAADVSQQIAFNPNLTQAELATNLSKSFGENIYDVNMATTYPTSTLPGAGGMLSDLAAGAGAVAGLGVAAPAAGTAAANAATTPAAGTTAGAAAGAAAGLTPAQIANLIKAGVSIAGVTGATKALQPPRNTATGMQQQSPTQGMPQYTPEYYQQLQQYYNAYLPQTPRDVVTPLQQWYNAKSGA